MGCWGPRILLPMFHTSTLTMDNLPPGWMLTYYYGHVFVLVPAGPETQWTTDTDKAKLMFSNYADEGPFPARLSTRIPRNLLLRSPFDLPHTWMLVPGEPGVAWLAWLAWQAGKPMSAHDPDNPTGTTYECTPNTQLPLRA